MSKIPIAILEALEKWRSDHKAAQDVLIEVMEDKRTGGALHYRKKANESILVLSMLIEKHEIDLSELFPDENDREKYEDNLRTAKFHRRMVLKKK